jgi:hypothetical protein
MPRATRFETSNRLQKLSYRIARLRAQLGNDFRAATVVTEPRPWLLSRDREGAVLRVVTEPQT